MYEFREFPGGPVVRTQCFHYCGPGSVPGWGTGIPQASGQPRSKTKQNIVSGIITNLEIMYVSFVYKL